MRAAQDERVHARGFERRQIFGHHGFDHHVAAVHAAVLHERHKQRARLREQLQAAVGMVQITLISPRTDGRGRADDAHFAAQRLRHRAAACRLDRADDRDIVLPLEQIERHGRNRVARDDNRLQVELAQEGHVLSGVFDDNVSAAGAVGHAAGIPEVDDVLLRHERVQAAHRGQPAQAGVEHADRTVIHRAPPAPARSAGRAARGNAGLRDRTAWDTC